MGARVGSQGRQVRAVGGLAVPDANRLGSVPSVANWSGPAEGTSMVATVTRAGTHDCSTQGSNQPSMPNSRAAGGCVPASVPLSRRSRIAKLIEDTTLSVEAAVFAGHLEKLPRDGEISWIGNSFSDLYLPSCGEVAERLKAAVC